MFECISILVLVILSSLQQHPCLGSRHIPQTESYTAPLSNDLAPFNSYDAPSNSYDAPSNSYDAPLNSYDATSNSYDAPSDSYDAPSNSYDAPSNSYDAPSNSYDGPRSDYSGRQHSGPTSGRRVSLVTGYQAPNSVSGDDSAPSTDYSKPSNNYISPSDDYSAPAESYASPLASDYSTLTEYKGDESVTDERRVRPGSPAPTYQGGQTSTFYEAPTSGVLTFFDEKGSFLIPKILKYL